LYLTALGAFNRTVFEVQERLEARSDTNDLQRELLAAARAGLDLLLRDACAAECSDEIGVGAPRLDTDATGGAWRSDAGTETSAPFDTDASLGEHFEQFGDQLLQLGLVDESRRAYAKSLAFKQRLADADTTRPELQLELLECLKRFVALELNRGAADRAREYCTRALAITKAFAEHPLFVGEESVVESLLDQCREVEEGAR
jgi:hypothetical protein